MTTKTDAARVDRSARNLAIGLVALVALTVVLTFVGGDFGPFFAAYVSTAMVTFGGFEVARRMLRRRPLWRGIAVLGAGVATAALVNAATVLGPGLYAAFLIGQVFTVGLVLWLRHVTAER